MRTADDLRDRMGSIGATASALAGEVPDHLQRVPEHLEHARAAVEDRIERAEPYVRRGSIGLLGVAQAVIGVAIAVPRLVTRALTIARVLTERAEIASDRGHELAERARDLAHRVEPSRRQRRARSVRGGLLVGVGFAVGFAVGWIMADAKGLAARDRDRQTAIGHAEEIARRDAEDTEGEPGAPHPLREGGPRRVTVIEGGTPAR